MQSRQRAPKGSVQVYSPRGWLQLAWSHGGRKYRVSLGLQDNAVNRRVAEAKASLISSDILYERFDESLAKYKPQAALSTQETPAVNLSDIWTQFLDYKRPQCSPNTMKYTYGVFSSYLNRSPYKNLEDATLIRDWAIKAIPLPSAKRFIAHLAQACEWGIKSGLIDQNPFRGMAPEIKLPKATRNDEGDVFPFNRQERDAIIDAIATNKFCPKTSKVKHSYYLPFIRFLFLTGCRHSEAVALQWKHVSPDCRFVQFQQAVIGTDEGRVIRAGLKTQERRKFPCNESLRGLLLSIKPDPYDPEALVFPSPQGKPIDSNNFRNRTWKPVLLGLGLTYRKMYQTRHTFATIMHHEGNLGAKDLSRLLGNSEEICLKLYISNKRELFVPDI